ncbi:MAG: hypothetical protein Q4D27_05305 [Coriobacteriia bacterium]|nr:hypothetical protein [Coriobacteriia bacterium]
MGDEYVIIDLLFMFILLGIIGMIITRRQRMGGKTPTATTQNAEKQNTASEAKKRADNPEKIVEDVRMTQTSRIVDAIQILDDLGSASPGYRHYCELVGQSQPSGGVTAPYSQRQVAYYDLRCYRIEVRGGQDVETLVAHERSIDPFYFRDASGDNKVYVDLDSFGNNCILVNSTNRVEGPNSDFAKKFSSVIGAANTKAATGVPGTMAAVQSAIERGRNMLRGVRSGMGIAFNGGMQPAYAGAQPAPSTVSRSNAAPFNIQLAASSGRGAGARPGGGGQRPQSQPQRPPQQSRPQQGGRPGSYGYGYGGQHHGSSGFPNDLNIFLGSSMGSGHLGGPYYHQKDPTSAALETLVGMSLGALVGSFANTSSQPRPQASSPYNTSRPDPTNVSSINGFRGYRIIEDVVPLNSPIYALGEIYRNGPDVFIGRSVASEFPSSYFATKPEAEVIAALS